MNPLEGTLRKTPDGYAVHLSPADVERLGLQDGSPVLIVPDAPGPESVTQVNGGRQDDTEGEALSQDDLRHVRKSVERNLAGLRYLAGR